MAQITQQQILALSEPVEQIYSNVVDALLVNLAKHLKGGGTLTTEQWEMQKLSEMGQLTQESIEIIANLTGLAPEEIEKAMENAVRHRVHTFSCQFHADSAQTILPCT